MPNPRPEKTPPMRHVAVPLHAPTGLPRREPPAATPPAPRQAEAPREVVLWGRCGLVPQSKAHEPLRP